MSRMKWDSPELINLEIDLTGAPYRIQRRAQARMAGQVGALLSREMKRDAKGHKGNWFGKPGTSYNTPLERHVSHEMVGQFEVEAGIENKGAGKLGHIIAYGSVNNGPAYDPMAGPRRALPKIVEDLADTAEESLLGDEQ